MSGGFFRGTSADQDTRFSNKQAKLLKSQKFPSELEHLVDITKVKMDVMKPWIAQRVTELLGFEDEVLINFIYGLLEGKAVNGKEVQISLTGFMEKNTGKFMKELWQLLLSAQNNASGVPQQFLDAKEDETRKKQAESDMIKSEMQKKKEKEARDIEEEKLKKLDGVAGMRRIDAATLEPSSKRHPEDLDDKEMSARNGARGRNRVSKSPRSPGGVSLSPRNRRSKSMSKSFSNSRSYSEERHKSRSLSRSPTSRRRSSSSERVHRSRPRRSITPRRKYSPSRSISPPIRRSSHSRRRSTSRSRRTSPSPVRRRVASPVKYTRPRSPIRRRSRTPVRRRSRSPPRYRSRSPVRRRYASPVRRRSPSPVRRRYRRSPSPPHRSSLRRRSPSPIRNRRRSPTPPRYRPRSQEASSASPVRRLSPSLVMKRSRQRSPVRSPRERTRVFEKSSPDRYARHKGSAEDSDDAHDGPGSGVQRPSVSLRSPQRDTRVSAASSSPSPIKTQIHSKSPTNSRRRSPSEDRRSNSPYKSLSMQSKEHKVRDVRASPSQNPRDPKPHQENPDAITNNGEFDCVRINGDRKFEPSERSTTSSKPDVHKDMARVGSKHEYSPERSAGRHSNDTRNRSDDLELRKKEPENRSGKTSTKVLHPEDSVKEKGPATYKGSQKDDVKIQPLSDEAKHTKRLHETDKETVKVDEKGGRGSLSSGSDDSLELRNRKGHGHRKHRRSEKKEATSDESSDSEIEDRKEAKRRKKEEKRSRKEERRRRREERHKRREERRAEKLKAKSNEDSSAEETVSDPKKLEIELREKALESLRAKKGVGN